LREEAPTARIVRIACVTASQVTQLSEAGSREGKADVVEEHEGSGESKPRANPWAVMSVATVLMASDEGTYLSRLAERSGVPIGTTKGFLRGFERKGWITRIERPSGSEGAHVRRDAVWVTLTETGRENMVALAEQQRDFGRRTIELADHLIAAAERPWSGKAVGSKRLRPAHSLPE
jgi:DNA-binding MarR family transcriptional regulator